MEQRSPRNIVLCFDGREPAAQRANDAHTNIVSIYGHLVRNDRQVAAYYSGRGEVFLVPPWRWSFRRKLETAYHFLVEHFELGDRVFLFGFSHGAFTANALTEMLRKCGVVKENDSTLVEEAYAVYAHADETVAVDFRRARSWDCIPYLVGLFEAPERPGTFAPQRRSGRPLAPGIAYAYHALALDETQADVRLWDESRRSPEQILEQVWFPGSHDDIGGTAERKGLSDGPLKWMLGKATQAGLLLEADWEATVHPNPLDDTHPRSFSLLRLLSIFRSPDRDREPPPGALVHQSVVDRMAKGSAYLPRLPASYVVVPWENERPVEQLRLEQQLESQREAVKADPESPSALESLRDTLQKLGRVQDDEYRVVLNMLDDLRGKAAFEANLGKKIQAERLVLRNLDFFGSLEWDFSPQMNVLLGKNGYGKSHLLTLIVSLLQSAPQIEDFVTSRSRPDAAAELRLTREGQGYAVRRTKLGFQENAVGKVPVLAISELRFLDKSRDDFGKEKVDDKRDLKVHGAYHFLNRLPLGPILQDFLHSLCATYSERRTLDLPIVRLYHQVVRKLASTDFRIEKIQRVPHSSNYRIEVITEGNAVALPLQRASQGTLSVMALVSLIFDFLTSVFGEVPEEELTAQPAIVFIDELDAHMHPSWQRKVLGLLRTTFPSVQFFVAAHSPLVVAGCKEREVAVLRRNRAGEGFRLEPLARHFMGATTTELYGLLFEIEEKDETYLRYAAMYPFRREIQQEAAALQAKTTLTPGQQAQLNELLDKKRDHEHRLALARSLLEKKTRTPDEATLLGQIVQAAGLGSAPEAGLEEGLHTRLRLSGEEQARLQELQERQTLSAEDAQTLDRLSDDLYYLGEFERIDAERSSRRLAEQSALLDRQERLTAGETEGPGDAE